eukprot:5886720-Amphidinium_carterae.1
MAVQLLVITDVTQSLGSSHTTNNAGSCKYRFVTKWAAPADCQPLINALRVKTMAARQDLGAGMYNIV